MVPLSDDTSSGNTYGSVSSEDVPLVSQDNENDSGDADNYLATYFRSWRFAELIVCTVPVAIWIYFETVGGEAFRRKVPYEQVLSYNGEPLEGFEKPPVVFSQVNSEIGHGSTVGHYTSEFLNGFVPFVVQIVLVWYFSPALSTTFDRLDTLHRTICMYFVALGTTDSICNFVKFYVSLKEHLLIFLQAFSLFL